MEEKFSIVVNPSTHEKNIRADFLRLFREAPMPEDELLANLPLFLKRQDLSRVLFLNELYQKILPVHGSIIEFGVKWGTNLALLSSLRGTYEPYNNSRKIIGFDTFSGFPSVHEKDGKAAYAKEGNLSVSEGYEKYLDAVLKYHQNESPNWHVNKFELVKGDASVQTEAYFKKYPETMVALVYFDFDLYEPTKKSLEVILDHCTTGTVLAFDQLTDRGFPGETLALKEVLGTRKYRIQRVPYCSLASYLVLE